MSNQEKIDLLKKYEAQCIEWGIWSVKLGQAFDDAIKSLKDESMNNQDNANVGQYKGFVDPGTSKLISDNIDGLFDTGSSSELDKILDIDIRPNIKEIVKQELEALIAAKERAARQSAKVELAQNLLEIGAITEKAKPVVWELSQLTPQQPRKDTGNDKG